MAKRHNQIYTKEFDDFWKACPRREGCSKKRTWERWIEILDDLTVVRSEEIADIMYGIRRYAHDMKTQGQAMKFRQMPETFLYQRRYRDYERESERQEDKSIWFAGERRYEPVPEPEPEQPGE